MKKLDLVAEMNESGFEVLLAATYTVDLEMFEKLILRRLLYNGCSYIGIYADQSRIVEEISSAEGIQSLGRHYTLKGVIRGNAFHPKIYLLLGRKKAKLLLGSGNLTTAGWINNREVFGKFRYREGESENLSIIQDVYRQFIRYSETNRSASFEHIYRKAEVYDYLHPEKIQGLKEHQLCISHEEAIYSQLKKKIPEKLSEIHIFTPYFDGKLKVIEAMKRDFPGAKISIYLQEATSNFPAHMISKMKEELYKVEYIENTKKNYHGKLIFFIGDDQEYLLFGSPNCSAPALLESGTKGNEEASVLKEVEKGYFSDWMKNEIHAEMITDTIEVLPIEEKSSEMKHPVDFLDGILKNQCLTVYLRGEGIEEVHLGDERGEMEKKEEYCTVIWPGLTGKLSGIFKLKVLVKGETVEIKGWYHWHEELMRNQARIRESVYERLESDPDLQAYENVVDLLNDLLERLILDEKDLDRTSGQGITKDSRIHDQSELSEKESNEVSEIIEDYYVEDVDEDRPYGSIGGVDVLKELINKLLGYMTEDEEKNSELSKETKYNTQAYKRKIIEENHKTIELIRKRMNRFAYKFEKGILSSRYLQRVQPEIFITNIELYTGMLVKLTENEYIQYPIEELVELWIKLIDALSLYLRTHDVSEEKLGKYLVPNMVAALYIRDKSIFEYDDPSMMKYERKELIYRLETIHHEIMPIRRNYLDLYKPVQKALSKLGNPKFRKEDMKEFMEERFSFKTYEGFEKSLQDKFAKVCVSKEDGGVTLTYPIIFQFDFWVKMLMILKDLINLEEMSSHDELTITVHNEVQMDAKIRFQLIYSRKTKSIRKRIVYKNGRKLEEEKTRVEAIQIIDAEERGKESFLTQGFSLVSSYR